MLVKEKGESSMANPEYVLEMRTKAKCSTIKHREDERSSSFLLIVNLHNTDCVFSFFLLRFHYEISSFYAILRLAIKGRKEVFLMNEQEKTTMNIIEPEGLSSCGADSGTWCGQALKRVLIGMTLMGLTLNVLCLNYILPAIGMVFLLVGLRALRRENAGFKGGYVIAIIRTFYITVWMILDTTIYADVLTGTAAAVVLTAVNLVIVLAQVVCLWSGLKALRQKAGFEAKCGAAAALIVWKVVLCALGVMNWSGWIMFIVMIAAYIIIMRRLFALAGELDNAGCTITPVPVKVKDWQLVLSLAVLLAAGMACGYAFGGSYPMEWTPLDHSAQAEVQSTKAKLLELGFPEAVLNDLSSEDIASCEGATQILSRTEDKPVNDGREVTTQTGENSYRIDTVYDAKELRLTGVAVRVGEYRWIIFHHFLWTQPMNYCGTEAVQLWPNGQSDWWLDGDATGRVLCSRDGQTLTAAYHSLGTQDTFTTDFFGNSQSSINLTGVFSMPRGSENQRGYVCFPIQIAQEDTYVNSWVNYTHQNTWAQYPARTARDSMWSSSAFKTIQSALQFDATEGRMLY